MKSQINKDKIVPDLIDDLRWMFEKKSETLGEKAKAQPEATLTIRIYRAATNVWEKV